VTRGLATAAALLGLLAAAAAAPAAPAGSGAAAAAGPAPASDGWQLFRSQAGRFAVELPAAPVARAGSHMTLGGRIEFAVYRVESGGSELRIEHHEVPRLARVFLSDAALLGRAESDFLSDEDAAEVSARSMRVQGHPARELRYRVRDRDVAGRARFLLAGGRLYLLAVLRAGGAADAGLDRFFDSFRLRDD
jgi:hypothetical protein